MILTNFVVFLNYNRAMAMQGNIIGSEADWPLRLVL